MANEDPTKRLPCPDKNLQHQGRSRGMGFDGRIRNDQGMFVSRKEAESTTLTEALDRYEQEISSRKKSHAIEKVYIRTLKKSFLSSRFLAGINGSDVSKYRDARLKDVSPTDVRHELSLLSHLFTIAIKKWSMFGLINPVTQIRKPTPNKPRDRRLLPGEEKALIEACESYGGDLPHIVRLALETGMRRSEIAGMIWDLVDLKKRTVTLPETKSGSSLFRRPPSGSCRIFLAGSTGMSGGLNRYQ